MKYLLPLFLHTDMTSQKPKAKRKELENWKKFNAFEIVDDIGQQFITTWWVVNEKENHDGMKVQVKAHLCLRGYQEKEKLRSDSPTASREMLKVVLVIAVNEGWKAECLDVTAAFLQGAAIERDVFVKPPKEEHVEGTLWKLLKSGYGLNDASR